MRRRPFTAVLHGVFRASLVAPIELGSVGCGSGGGAGTSAISDASPDGEAGPSATVDAGTDPDACSTPPWDGSGTISGNLDSGGCFVNYTLPVTGDPARCGLSTSCAYNFSLCPALRHGFAYCSLSGSSDVSCVSATGPCMGFPGGGCCGRRPHGLTLQAASGSHRVGLWFAELAAREEASIAAFEILAEELEAHGAPGRLVASARRAARDERRHARIMTAFAARYGGTPRRPRVERGPVRSLEAIAAENATEGCVRETFGALVGMWQAKFASDPRVREAMKGVARDEGQHAALSWQVARWIEPKLRADARARLEAAKEEAMRQLERELAGDAGADVVRVAGTPAAHHARRLFGQARAMLWMGDPAQRAA